MDLMLVEVGVGGGGILGWWYWCDVYDDGDNRDL